MGPEPDPNDPTPGMHIWGWMSPDELRWLMEQAEQMGSIAEIGCLHGRSAFALATACPGPVICIDPWDDDADASFPSFMENVGWMRNVYPLRGRSLDVVARRGEVPWKSVPLAVAVNDNGGWPPIEMVFLDGAHAYESVLADICAWLPHTEKLICGHDYYDGPEAGFPGVAKAVRQVFGDRVTVAPGTSIWWVNLEMSGRDVAAGLPEGPVTWVDEYGVTNSYDFAW